MDVQKISNDSLDSHVAHSPLHVFLPEIVILRAKARQVHSKHICRWTLSMQPQSLAPVPLPQKEKGSRSASNLWLIKQQTETNQSQIKSRIKGNLTLFCSLRLWFMIDLQMWTLRLCLIPWIGFPSGCTQAVTARLCKMPRAKPPKPPVQAVIDIADTMRPRRHWAAEAQAAKLQVKSITSWRWLCWWRSSEHDAKWKLKQDFDLTKLQRSRFQFWQQACSTHPYRSGPTDLSPLHSHLIESHSFNNSPA